MYVNTVVAPDFQKHVPEMDIKINKKKGASFCPSKLGGWARTYQYARYAAGWDALPATSMQSSYTSRLLGWIM